MLCPRCQQQVPDGPECAACGVVIEKFLAKEARDREARRHENPTGQAAGVAAAAGSTAGAAPVAAAAAGPAVGQARSRGPHRVSDRHRIGLYGQLARMLEAGLSPVEALRLTERHSRGALAAGLGSMRAGIEAGATFAQAAAGLPGLFPADARVLLEAGEATGGLPAALRALASTAEVRLDVRRQIARACIYPFVLFSLVFFVPRLHLVFSAGLGAYLRATLVPYLLTLVVLLVAVWLLPAGLSRLLGPGRSQRLLRRLPLLGGLWRRSARARFARHLGGALEAGLPVGTALRLATRATGDPRWIDAAGPMERAIGQGASLHAALAQSGLLDDEFLLAVAAGERVGRLGEALEQQARLLQAELLHRIHVSVQLAAVAILLLTYAFVARAIVGEFQSVLGGTQQQMQQLMKELGGAPGAAGMEDLLRELGQPAGASRLPPELEGILP